MKGIVLLSDLFLLLTLIALTIIVTLFLWYFIIFFEFGLKPTGAATPREVTLRLFIKPVKYDSVILSFLELEHDGISMKKIINAIAIQNKTNIWIDGKWIDAKSVSEGFLTPMIRAANNGYDKDYLLKISPQDIDIAEFGSLTSTETPLGIQKVSTKLFLLHGEAVDLQLFVRD